MRCNCSGCGDLSPTRGSKGFPLNGGINSGVWRSGEKTNQVNAGVKIVALSPGLHLSHLSPMITTLDSGIPHVATLEPVWLGYDVIMGTPQLVESTPVQLEILRRVILPTVATNFGLNVKCLLLMVDLIKNWDVCTIICETIQSKIVCKSVHQFTHYYMRTDGQAHITAGEF
jgi:hypothetical protein